MGAGQSRSSTHETSAARVTPISSSTGRRTTKPGKDAQKMESKVLDTPIFMEDGDISDTPEESFPIPTGHEYDLMDKIASELPSYIDDESRRQVEDYMEACDKGKGPMVACFATAEYLSLFERKHKEAYELYKNCCFRPKKDKSPNGVLVDGTKAYPPACFNLAQMFMTGKGGTTFDRREGYKHFDRACRGGHGGACHMQAQMLLSEPGALGKGIPYNPKKAADLMQKVCDDGDPLSCFTLATILLRGSQVSTEAESVTPQEARGEVVVDGAERVRQKSDKRVALKRDPPRAEALLLKACMTNGHAPSCYNLAVMYSQGDDGVPADPEKARKFQDKTEEMVSTFGGFGM